MDTVYANKFQRNFMIFVNEDSGFEEAGKSSGHVRLEIRAAKGNWSCHHNLRTEKGSIGMRCTWSGCPAAVRVCQDR